MGNVSSTSVIRIPVCAVTEVHDSVISKVCSRTELSLRDGKSSSAERFLAITIVRTPTEKSSCGGQFLAEAMQYRHGPLCRAASSSAVTCACTPETAMGAQKASVTWFVLILFIAGDAGVTFVLEDGRFDYSWRSRVSAPLRRAGAGPEPMVLDLQKVCRHARLSRML